MKKLFLLIFVLFSLQTASYSQSLLSGASQNNDIISKFKHLSVQQLYDTAEYYSSQKNSKDIALICYSLVYNTPYDKKDTVLQKLICRALVGASRIYILYCDNKLSLEALLRAKEIAIMINFHENLGRVYNNIGNIHYAFKKYDLAKKNYLLALNFLEDIFMQSAVFSNLGSVEFSLQKFDSAMFYFKQAIVNRNENTSVTISNIAGIFREWKQYDSCFFYLQEAIELSKIFGIKENECLALYYLGDCFIEIGQFDSAKYYLQKSYNLALEEKYLSIVANCLNSFAQLEEQKGNILRALEYYKQYTNINDSLFDVTKYASLMQLEFLNDMTQAETQIKQLAEEQKINEKTIYLHRVIQLILIAAFSIVILILGFVFSQNKKLNASYRLLVSKSVEMINQEEDKKRKPQLHNELSQEFVERILEIMNNKELVCQSDFSLNKLVAMLDSNSTYISQVLNKTMGKNFNKLLNEYRIKTALKMLQEPKYFNFTIEAIAKEVGYDSRNSFSNIFKEIVGVTPAFYVRSLKESKEMA